MPLLATEAIVLHAFDYLESSRIIRLLTREAGIQSTVARGARKSRGRYGSALDLFAYARDDDDALVIAAGIPPQWFDGDGVAVDGLRTPFGPLGYDARRSDGRLRLSIAAGTPATRGAMRRLWMRTAGPAVARTVEQSRGSGYSPAPCPP